jgi:Ca2+-binding RTX toxin-like protein
MWIGSNGDDYWSDLEGRFRDFLVGLGGNDMLNGHTGPDLLWGNDGNDTLQGDHGLDLLLGGLGADELLGEWGDDRIWAGWGADRLWGDAGDDELIAIDMDGQQDVLFCGPGDRDRAIAVRNEDVVDWSCEVVIYVN